MIPLTEYKIANYTCSIMWHLNLENVYSSIYMF